MKKQFSLVKISPQDAPMFGELYSCLYPSDEEISKGLPVGADVVGSFKDNDRRSLKFHKKYFALIKLAYDNLPEHLEERYKTLEEFRIEMKMQAGARDKMISITGTEYWVPKSMAFNKMGAEEFEKLYSKTLDFICSYVLVGIEKKSIDEQILRFL